MKLVLGLLLVGFAPASAFADQTFNAGTGATWDCAKDAVVTINTSGGTYTFKGACKDINVNGSASTIQIESIADLTVNGATNTITIGAADHIDVNGSNNTVTYARPLKAKVDIGNRGTNNAIKQGAGAAAATTGTTGTTGTTATGTGAGAAITPPAAILDCAKKKSVSIAKGGAYNVIGTCDKIAVSAGNTTIAIEAVKNLSITGSKNTVSVAKADKIAVMGSNNTVAYVAGLSGAAPKVATMGKNNTVSQGAAPAPSTAATTTSSGTATPAAPVPAGAIDCAKNPNHSIDDNDGTYVFVGACQAIAVNGNDNKVIAESAKSVAVNGNDNTVSVTSVDTLGLMGNNNKAMWKKGLSVAKPKVTNLGNDNKVSQAK